MSITDQTTEDALGATLARTHHSPPSTQNCRTDHTAEHPVKQAAQMMPRQVVDRQYSHAQCTGAKAGEEFNRDSPHVNPDETNQRRTEQIGDDASILVCVCVHARSKRSSRRRGEGRKRRKNHCANENVERETKFNELRTNQAQMRRLRGPRWSFEVYAHE